MSEEYYLDFYNENQEIECKKCGWKGLEDEVQEKGASCPKCGVEPKYLWPTKEQSFENWEQSIRIQFQKQFNQLWEDFLEAKGLDPRDTSKMDKSQMKELNQQFENTYLYQITKESLDTVIENSRGKVFSKNN